MLPKFLRLNNLTTDVLDDKPNPKPFLLLFATGLVGAIVQSLVDIFVFEKEIFWLLVRLPLIFFMLAFILLPLLFKYWLHNIVNLFYVSSAVLILHFFYVLWLKNLNVSVLILCLSAIWCINIMARNLWFVNIFNLFVLLGFAIVLYFISQKEHYYPYLMSAVLISYLMALYKLRVLFVIHDRNKALSRLTFRMQQANYELNRTKEELALQSEELQRKQAQIKQMNQDLMSSVKDVTDGVKYARRLQANILFNEQELLQHHPDAFVFSQPRDLLGGDFFWLHNAGQKKILAVADCTGHGVPGALMTILAHGLLNQLAVEKSIMSPKDLAYALNEKVAQGFEKGGLVHNDLHEFRLREGLTIGIVEIDQQQQKLRYCGVGQPLYFFSEGKLTVLSGTRIPIGWEIENSPEYILQETDYQKGDQIFLFSDGFKDQIGGKQYKTYKSKPFADLLSSLSCFEPHQQKERLFSEFISWKGPNRQTDDVMVLGVKL